MSVLPVADVCSDGDTDSVGVCVSGNGGARVNACSCVGVCVGLIKRLCRC